MRAVTVLLCCGLLCSSMLGLAGCDTHEDVKSSYVGTSSMDQAQVTQLLNQQGFRDITNLHKNGPDWIGSATKGGNAVNFDIDKAGTIHTR